MYGFVSAFDSCLKSEGFSNPRGCNVGYREIGGPETAFWEIAAKTYRDWYLKAYPDVALGDRRGEQVDCPRVSGFDRGLWLFRLGFGRRIPSDAGALVLLPTGQWGRAWSGGRGLVSAGVLEEPHSGCR